jgi:hypothetical protein
MKTSIKSIHAMKGTLLIRTLFACLLVVAFSFAAIPTRAGDAEDKAKKAFADWKAAKEAVATAKEKLADAQKALQNAMTAVAKSGGKTTAEQEAALAKGREAVAAAEAALREAEKQELAARIALENAIAELPDGPLKDQLKRERNFPSLVTANGLYTVKFDTPSGQLTVNLPDDMRAGDTISGTVIADPKGQTQEERTKNKAELQAYVVAIFPAHPPLPKTPPIVIFDLSKGLAQSGGSTIVTATFAAPKKVNLGLFLMPNENSPMGACGRSGSLTAINESCSPISQLVFDVPRHPSGAVITPDPKITPTFIIPPLGQTGRPILITGPFDGNASNTTLNWAALRTSVQDFEKNTENVSGGFGLIAESPRQAVFTAPENVAGPMELHLTEGNTRSTGTYRNVKVNLTAPKTSLLKGESTELHCEVSGLQGLTAPVPLTLESHGVITMVGGTYQPLVIQPSQVGADGRYSTTRGITGVQAGGWGATATVMIHQYDFCLQDDSNPRTVILVNSFTGNYLFTPPGGTSLSGKGTITMKGCIFTLEHNEPDRRVMSSIDQCTHTGSASVQTVSPKVKFTITDRNTTDNTCAVQ